MKYNNTTISICITFFMRLTNLQAEDLMMPEYNVLDPIDAIHFTPADEFTGPEMIGLYYPKNKTATINDPLKTTNTCTFNFNSVTENQTTDTDNIKFIGSYTPKDTIESINLYGILE